MKSSVPISALLHHKSTALWSISPELTVFEAIKLMADKNIGALLVISGGRLVGGLFVTASGEAGRQPPRYEPSGRFGLGLGFRLGPS